MLRPEQTKVLNNLRVEVRRNFASNPQWLFNEPIRRDLKEELSNFKGLKCVLADHSYDLSTDENYLQFVGKVEDLMDKKQLQQSDMCAQMIGRKILRGETPINLDVLGQENEFVK